MASKKRLILLAAGATSAVLFAAFVPGSASAETDRRLCGAKVAQRDGKAVAYMVAKVSKDDSATCDEAINNKVPPLLAKQIKSGKVPSPNGDEVSTNVPMATCESIYADLGYPSGTDQCSHIEFSPNSEKIFPVLILRGDWAPSGG